MGINRAAVLLSASTQLPTFGSRPDPRTKSSPGLERSQRGPKGITGFNGTFAPFGNINDSGFQFRLTGSLSWYDFLISGAPRIIGSGHTFEQDLLAGYQIPVERLSIIGLIGPAFGESISGGVTTDQVGLKAIVSSFATPTDNTMTYNAFSYSSIGEFSQLQGGGKSSSRPLRWSRSQFIVAKSNSRRKQYRAAAIGRPRLKSRPGILQSVWCWAHDQQLGSGQ